MMKQVKIDNSLTYYYITEDGKLYNKKTKRWYKGSLSGGYWKYDLTWNQKKYPKLAHRLVAEAFIENPNNYEVVNHKDGNKLNNNISNLEWTTFSENNYHAYETGLKRRTNGRKSRIQFSEDMLRDREWKQYKDSNYYISDKGEIINIKTKNLLKGKITKDGYIEWCLNINGKKYSILAHRIIYETFLGELKKGLAINHKNGNKTDNQVSNLEQVSYSENIYHSYYHIGHKNMHIVGKFNLEGKLIEKYPSCAEAARQNPGCFPNIISEVCNNKRKTHKGYVWKYLTKK